MKYSEKAEFVASKRLLMTDEKQVPIESIDGMFQRVARFLSDDEETYEKFYGVMKDLDFLPNSPCLVNAGKPGKTYNLSACFVLGIEDSISSIYSTLHDVAKVHKQGGGTGFNFSSLRPSNSNVASTNGVASGPVSFMHLYDASTDAIKQGGVRRGANIGILNVSHPDIEEFIDCKQGNGELENFNISVAITDEFMKAVYHDTTFDLHFGDTRKTVSAKVLWNKIIANAHKTGDPGLLFIDKINKHNPLSGSKFELLITNPCGEVPLSVDEACCLGSVNWSNMVDEFGEINKEKLASVTTIGVELLNAIIDKSTYPTENIRKKVLLSRKIGLGVMGVADAFIKLKMVYGSEESLETIEELNSVMLDTCVLATHEYPKTFEAITSYKAPLHIIESLNRIGISVENYSPANATLMTIAPTGTLSMLADCSSGIEPVFFFESTENRVGESKKYTHPLYAEYKEHFPKINVPRYFIESHDVDVDAHIQTQAAFQKFVCNAVSKTINLPRGSSLESVDKAYKDAYMLGCKGVTVYIDGSLDNQTMEGSNSYTRGRKFIEPVERPETLTGSTHEILTGFGELYVTINYHGGFPFEVLCNIGKSGASENAKAEAVGKLISLALRSGISMEHIIKQIEGIVGSKSQYTEYGLVTSIPDAIAKILINKVLTTSVVERSVGMQTCIDCNSTELRYEGSCLVCNACGWKSCGN